MATTFNYRFNSILKVKEMTEEDKKNKMAYEQKKLNSEKDKFKILLEKKKSNVDRWNEITKDDNVVRIKDLQKTALYIEKIDDLVDEQSLSVQKQEVNLNESRRQLIEAKKQTKIYEKLKDKDYKHFLANQSKNEANLIDQIVTYKC